ncbi:YcgJ family protein [Ochrobactrum sp. GPK 3]|uniref:YcgJ family protein n=1 Tax=Brucella sp. 22210 TaxID=3453892 RepID=UPI0031384CCE
MRKSILFILAAGFATVTSPTLSAQKERVFSPVQGVLCDQYFCANKHGISNGLTARYLGQKAADKLIAMGNFDRASFTFSNGVFCETKDRRCYQDRYFRSAERRGLASNRYTRLLFGIIGLPRRPR